MAKDLTDRTIKALKPAAPGKRVERWDGVVSGLGIRVTDTGAKSFVLNARYPGSPNHRSARRALGGYGELTLEQARNKARSWLELLGRGIDPRDELEERKRAEQRKCAGTFASVAEDFVREKLSKERRGHDAEIALRRELIPRWGARQIPEISRGDVKLMLEQVKARAPYQAHALLALARRLFSWAIERERFGLEHNPCDNINGKTFIGEKPPRTRHLSDAEIRAFWRACEELGYPHGDLGRALLLTGTRHREMAAAPWSEFDLAKATWTIDQSRFKSDSQHTVPLVPDMLALLTELPRFKSGPFLFSTCYGKVATDITEKVKAKIDAVMARELGVAEVKPWRVHDLRRTVRTNLAAMRIPDHIAEMVLGHGKKGLQRVYDQHQYETEMREALERWAARLRTIVSPPAPNVTSLDERRQAS
jgi:integrase